MPQSRLIELNYYDPKAQVRLKTYADTIILDRNEKDSVISDEVPEALLDIRDGFGSMNARLEKELSKETRLIPLSLTETYKEAA